MLSNRLPLCGAAVESTGCGHVLWRRTDDLGHGQGAGTGTASRVCTMYAYAHVCTHACRFLPV